MAGCSLWNYCRRKVTGRRKRKRRVSLRRSFGIRIWVRAGRLRGWGCWFSWLLFLVSWLVHFYVRFSLPCLAFCFRMQRIGICEADGEGAGKDNMGKNAELVHKETIEDVVRHFPRKGWSSCFAATIREENRLKPWAHTTALGEEDFPNRVLNNQLMAPYDDWRPTDISGCPVYWW